ncbi:MAG: response regulator transcription factor [Omnitrophica WOR_2 bacterium]
MSPDNIKVLIVDDITQVRQGLVTMLRLASKNLDPKIEVTGEAQNGEEAIEQATILHPDVILMDLEMPVVDGFSAAQGIKSEHPSIWVVALTIHGDSATRMKASEAGFDAFVEKGAPKEELIQAIQNCRETCKGDGETHGK